MNAISTAAAAFVAGAALTVVMLRQTGDESDVRSVGTTYGEILVDSPEVYTRERMVNDRFRQEAWLLEALDQDVTPTVQGQLETSRSRANTSFLGTDVGAQPDARAPSLASPEAVPASGGPPAGPTPASPQLSAIERFRSNQAYREEIRNAIIENQLDDRHDLRGNTLYRLKFDATIIPGDDTSAWARVRVTFENEKSDDLGELRTIYDRWVDAVEERVNNRARERMLREKTSPDQKYASLLRNAQEFYSVAEEGPEPAEKQGPEDAGEDAFSLPDEGDAEEGPVFPPPGYSEENHELLLKTLMKSVDCSHEETCVMAMYLLGELKGLNLSFRNVAEDGDGDGGELTELFENKFVEFDLKSQPVSIKVRKRKGGFEAFRGFLKPSVFAYAVTPRESTQQISSASQVAVAEQIRAIASADLGASDVALDTQSSDLFSEYARFLDSRPIVVGVASYPGSNDPTEASGDDSTRSRATVDSTSGGSGEGATVSSRGQVAQFGWLIGPKLVVGPSSMGMYRHHPSQNSLSALVSVPSWWQRADITIETDWVDASGTGRDWLGSDGGAITKRQTTTFEVALPGDEEELLTFMLLGGRRPEPYIQKVEPVVAVSGDGGPGRAEVLIVGENLWRSAVVTINSIRSKQISVLPNMKGIVATFGLDELAAAARAAAARQEKAALRVWTSQGVATSSVPAEKLVAGPGAN